MTGWDCAKERPLSSWPVPKSCPAGPERGREDGPWGAHEVERGVGGAFESKTYNLEGALAFRTIWGGESVALKSSNGFGLGLAVVLTLHLVVAGCGGARTGDESLDEAASKVGEPAGIQGVEEVEDVGGVLMQTQSFDAAALLDLPIVEWPTVAQVELTKNFMAANHDRLPFLSGGGDLQGEVVDAGGFRSVGLFTPRLDDRDYEAWLGHSSTDFIDSAGVVLVESADGKLFGAPTLLWEDLGGTGLAHSHSSRIAHVETVESGGVSHLRVDIEHQSIGRIRDYESHVEAEIECEEELKEALGRPVSFDEVRACIYDGATKGEGGDGDEIITFVTRQVYTVEHGLMSSKLLAIDEIEWSSGFFVPAGASKTSWPPSFEGEVAIDPGPITSWIEGWIDGLCAGFGMHGCVRLEHLSQQGIEAMGLKSHEGGQLWLYDGEWVISGPLPLAQEGATQGVGENRLELHCSPTYDIELEVLSRDKVLVSWKIERKCKATADLELMCIKELLKRNPNAMELDTRSCTDELRDEAAERVVWQFAWLIDLKEASLLARIPLKVMPYKGHYYDDEENEDHERRLRGKYKLSAQWGASSVELSDAEGQSRRFKYGTEAIFELPGLIDMAQPLTVPQNPLEAE